MALIGQAVSEKKMFEYYGDIHVYIAPGQGQATPRGQKFFININILSICPFPASFALQIIF